MTRSDSLKQPSLRRLLSFCLWGGIAGLGLAYFSWCPVQCWRIRRLLESSQLEAASALAKSTALHDRQCAECQYLDAKAARRLGDFRHAAQALERAASLDWDATDLARERTLALVQTGRTAEFEDELKAIFATELNPAETEEVYEALAYGHLAAFDGPEFQQCLDFWLQWNPQAVKPRLMRAQFAQQLTKNFEASNLYEAIVLDHPNCREARLGWGACLLHLNQPAAAEVQLRICLNDQREAKAAVMLAQSLIQTGQSTAAADLLKEFKETPILAERAEVLEALGRWCLDQNQVDEAVVYLEESVKLAPEAAPAWHSLASAYSLQGQLEKSKHALSVSQETQKRLQRLGVIVVEISAHPQLLNLRIEAAQILFEQDMGRDAVAWLHTVLSRDPQHQQAHELLAEYYEQQGLSDLARQHSQWGERPTSKGP
jgi:Tfp pilus assembly protein PilF